MDLISVIVPVYKVEAYLDRCVESIVNQTYRNLEIILVDDGSPDNCPAMCDAWAKKDSRIKVIHKPNGGLSDARNAGMAAAMGEFIAFVDSDDWIKPDMYCLLIESLKRTDSDISSCGAIRVWEDDTPSKPMLRFSGEHIMNKEEAMQALIQSTFLIQTVWNKLYKTELIQDILFETGKIHEDEFWSWQAIARANRVVAIENNLYNYAQRSGSIMGDGYTGKPMLVIEAKLNRQRYIAENLPGLADVDNVDLLYTCYFQCIQVLRYEKGEIRKVFLMQIRNVAESCHVNKKYVAGMPLLKRVRLWTLRHMIVPTCQIDIATGRE